VSILLLTLFKLRAVFGLSLLFIALGVFQFLQVFLISSLYVKIANGIVVSPGMLLFTGTLFTVLLIYIREDALETRKVIYGLLIANIVLALLLRLIGWSLNETGTINIYNLPKEFYTVNAKVIFVGTIVLLIDSVMLLYLYEIISKYISPLFLRIFFTMVLVLGIDSLLFSLGIFTNQNQFQGVLISSLFSKSFAALIYSILFTIYLIYLDKSFIESENKADTLEDLFYKFTFRQKYEQVSKEKELQKIDLQETKKYLQTIFDSTTDAIFIHDGETGAILDVNKQMCEMYGYNKLEVLNREVREFSLGELPYSNIESQQYLQKAKKEGIQTFEWKSRHKNGTIFWTETSLGFTDISGKNICIATVRNIDDRKKAEEKAIREIRLNKTILETTMDGYILADDKGQIKNVNVAYCSIVGYSEAELLTKNISQLELKISKEKLNNRIQEIIKNGHVQFETQHKHKNGNSIDLEVSISILKSENKPLLAAFVRDITQKNQEKYELTKLNNQLLEAEKVTHFGFLDWNLVTNELQVSPEVKRIYQIPENTKDIIALLNNRIHPQDLNFVNEALKLATKGTKDYNIDHRILQENGAIRWLNSRAKLLKNENGQPVRLLGTISDITERKGAENKIKIEKNKAQQYLNVAGVMLISLNIKGIVKLINPKGCEILGYSKEEIIGKNWFDNFLPVHLREPIKNISKKVFLGDIESMKYYENEILTKSGEFKLIAWKNEIIKDTEGTIVGILSSGEDITERKQAELDLKLYAEKLVEKVSKLNKIHKLGQHLSVSLTIDELVNKALDEMVDAVAPDISLFYLLKENQLKLIANRKNNIEFDFSGEEKHNLGECLCGLAAKTMKTIFSEDIHKDTRCTLDNCKNLGMNSFVALPLIADNKLIGLIGLGNKTKQNFKNNILFLETLAFDIAVALQNLFLLNNLRKHKAELEETVKQRTAQLEHSNNELRDFAQIVSHDLKAPLRAISQLSFWISQDYADKIDEEGQSQLKLLIGRVQRLDNLIEGILQYSRAGKVREKEVEINCNEVVNETIQLLNPPSTIKIVIENKLPNYIGDRTRFVQLFQNLIHNAIKSINKPRGLIKIGCIKKDEFLEFYVTDNGIGIEDKYFERIFNIFQRLESRDEQEGTGVGLSLVKRIVQIYGGDIWVNSKLGKGTTFLFKLPVIKNNNLK
jgi:PAS domain S-box-containing protein